MNTFAFMPDNFFEAVIANYIISTCGFSFYFGNCAYRPICNYIVFYSS